MVWTAPDGHAANRTLIRFPLYVRTNHPAPGTPPLCSSSG